MIRSLLSVLLGPALLFQLYAVAEKAPKPVEATETTSPVEARSGKHSDKADRLTQQLEKFINGAVTDGLLKPGSNMPQRGPKKLVKPSVAPTVTEASSTVDFSSDGCAAEVAFDFSDFASMTDYKQLIEYRGALVSAAGPDGIPNPVLMGKAYLTLGLGAEALRALKSPKTEEEALLKQLALLTVEREVSDVNLLRRAAKCDPEAGIWLASALLAQGSTEGVDVFRFDFSQFRTLPERLRVMVTEIAVPALLRMDEKLVAERIISIFNEEQISSASSLQLSQAILELADGNDEAADKVSKYLDKPTVQGSVLEALSDADALPDMVDNDISLQDAVAFIEQARNVKEMGVRLGLIEDVLTTENRLNDLASLAITPSIKRAALHHNLRSTLVSHLETEMASASKLDKIKAMQFLTEHQDFIVESREGANLFEKAKALASSKGFESIFKSVPSLPSLDPSAKYNRAEAAFRHGEHGLVFELAEASDDQRFIRLMGLSALKMNKTEALRTAVDRADTGTLLDLIEADVLATNPLIPDTVYEMVEANSNEAQARRLKRALIIRDGQTDKAKTRSSVPLNEIDDLLSRTSNATSLRKKETYN